MSISNWVTGETGCQFWSGESLNVNHVFSSPLFSNCRGVRHSIFPRGGDCDVARRRERERGWFWVRPSRSAGRGVEHCPTTIYEGERKVIVD